MNDKRFITDTDRQEAIIARLEAIERALNPPPQPDVNQLFRDMLAERLASDVAPLVENIARHATKGTQ